MEIGFKRPYPREHKEVVLLLSRSCLCEEVFAAQYYLCMSHF